MAAGAVAGCLPEDPSSSEETERLKAELAAAERSAQQVQQAASGKDAEIEALRSKVEELGKQLEAAAKMRVPSADEIEQKLSLETVRLRREAEKKLPGYKIQEVTLGEVNIPSPDYPFSCEVAMTLVAPDGKPGQLFWRGRGDLQGNWTYEPIEALSSGVRRPPPQVDAPPVADNRPPDRPAQPPAEPPVPVHDPLVSKKRDGGAMPADKTIIIDLRKLKPLNIPPQSGP
jgi:hypothetical protein